MIKLDAVAIFDFWVSRSLGVLMRVLCFLRARWLKSVVDLFFLRFIFAV